MLIMKIGEWLQEERKKHKLSYQSVSEEINIRIVRQGEIEHNLKRSTDEELEKYAVLFCVDPQMLKDYRDKGVW